MNINMIIPAFRDTAGVKLLLSSIERQLIPNFLKIESITFSCDESPEEMLLAIQEWAERNTSIRVSVRFRDKRAGKSSALQTFLSEMREQNRHGSIIVTCDEDIELTPTALDKLVTPFLSDHDLAVTWGIDVPSHVKWGRWASSFQMQFCSRLASRQPPNAPRAYGRFFAARVSKLENFEWRSDELDDVQLERFVRLSGARCLTVVEAKVLTLPAGNFRDFYLQTRRGHLARLRSRSGSEVGNHFGVNYRKRGRATFLNFRSLAATSLRYPHWAAAYLLARIATLRPISRDSFSLGAVWDLATSTKR